MRTLFHGLLWRLAALLAVVALLLSIRLARGDDRTRVRVALALAAARRPPQAPAVRPPQAPALRQPRSHRPAFTKARELLRRRRATVPYYYPAPQLMMPMVPVTGFGGFGGAGGC